MKILSKILLMTTAAVITMGCAANATPMQAPDKAAEAKKSTQSKASQKSENKRKKFRFNNDDNNSDWDDIDTDGDGKISQAEWDKHQKETGDGDSDFFEKFDTNNDGYVEETEVEEEVERIVERAMERVKDIDVARIERQAHRAAERAARHAERAARNVERSIRIDLGNLEDHRFDFDFDFGDLGNFTWVDGQDGDDFVDRWDENDDGSVSAEEYMGKREKAFKEMDTNNDGKLSEGEVDAYKESQRDKFRAKQDELKEKMRAERKKFKDERREVRRKAKEARKKRREARKQEMEKGTDE